VSADMLLNIRWPIHGYTATWMTTSWRTQCMWMHGLSKIWSWLRSDASSNTGQHFRIDQISMGGLGDFLLSERKLPRDLWGGSILQRTANCSEKGHPGERSLHVRAGFLWSERQRSEKRLNSP